MSKHRHDWLPFSIYEYSTEYICYKCGKKFICDINNPCSRLPEYGCKSLLNILLTKLLYITVIVMIIALLSIGLYGCSSDCEETVMYYEVQQDYYTTVLEPVTTCR